MSVRMLIVMAVAIFIAGLAVALLIPNGVHPYGWNSFDPSTVRVPASAVDRRIALRVAAVGFGALVAAFLLLRARRGSSRGVGQHT